MKAFLILIILQSFFFTKRTNENPELKNAYQETGTFKPFVDYESAFLEAKKANKKLLIYFSSLVSVPCEQMKENVFPDSTIKQLLANNFICFKVNLDDQIVLPIKDQYFSKIMGKKINTIGEKLQELQVSKFKTNMQPYFAIIGLNKKLLRERRGLQNKKEFISFINF